ncbi:unnamed protein product [Sphenostylis stenocarpa]|uniref:Uncharacterized protein n=1 Tax=Sphenostylis stenocarpa TaxID=92480 RepID=A0AA86VG02_9FABA|nr:unnamed protein product [Sphenostylis stenocarpa]
MGVETFFDLFSCHIPAAGKTYNKAGQSLPIIPRVKSLETEEDATEESSTQRKLKRRTQICSQRTRKSSRLLHVHVGQSLAHDQDANDIIDLCLVDNEGISGETYPNVIIVLENFDDYVDNLEDMLVMPHSENSQDHAPATDNQTIESAKLKLMEEIPLASVAFHEAKGNIKKADIFLVDLEAKKHTIQEIDDQIQQFQSKRKEICGALESMEERKVELTCGESVVNSILTLVGEIQLGMSEKSKSEQKKANSAQCIPEIPEKFIT